MSWGLPWVLLASTAVSNALHVVDVPGGIAALFGLCWTPLGLGAMWFLHCCSGSMGSSGSMLPVFSFSGGFLVQVSYLVILLTLVSCFSLPAGPRFSISLAALLSRVSKVYRLLRSSLSCPKYFRKSVYIKKFCIIWKNCIVFKIYTICKK